MANKYEEPITETLAFIYKQVIWIPINLLYIFTVYIIYMQSPPSMKIYKRYLIGLETIAVVFDNWCIFTDILPLFPVVGFRFRAILAHPKIIPWLYPSLSGLLMTCGGVMEACFQYRLYMLLSYKFITERTLFLFQVLFSLTVTFCVAAPGYFGRVPFEEAVEYYQSRNVSTAQMTTSRDRSVFFVAALNPWIYAHAIGCVSILSYYGCEILLIIYKIFCILDEHSGLMSARQRSTHLNAVFCLLFQMVSPAGALIPALSSGVFATFEVSLPYQYVNAFIPMLFALNTMWMSVSTLFFTLPYRRYIIKKVMRKQGKVVVFIVSSMDTTS